MKSYLKEVDGVAEEVQGQVHGGRAGQERLGGVDDVGIDLPAGVVDGAEVGVGEVAGVLAEINLEAAIQLELVDQAAHLLLTGGLVLLQVGHVRHDEATDCISLEMDLISRRTNGLSIFLRTLVVFLDGQDALDAQQGSGARAAHNGQVGGDADFIVFFLVGQDVQQSFLDLQQRNCVQVK